MVLGTGIEAAAYVKLGASVGAKAILNISTDPLLPAGNQSDPKDPICGGPKGCEEDCTEDHALQITSLIGLTLGLYYKLFATVSVFGVGARPSYTPSCLLCVHGNPRSCAHYQNGIFRRNVVVFGVRVREDRV